MRRIDLSGKKFGRWLVIKFVGGRPQSKWLCQCECGVRRDVAGANLRSGHSISCGVCTRGLYAKQNATTRDFRGVKNPRAKASKLKNGDAYIQSDSVWYKRASGIFYSARKRKITLGFNSAMELATYVQSIAPTQCPVFNKKFSDLGSGFSPWSPSIDKIDPKKGYVPGNIQVISLMANCMKRDATPTQLKQFAHWVLKAN
jgi:hypothetical protein